MNKEYIFRSTRLGFRNWMQDDVLPMSRINADPVVMEFFPGTKTMEETQAFVERMQKQFDEKGFCYFAVDRLDTGVFIGFVGISEQTFESDFTPCVDIGWRLSTEQWGNGFATEGAKRCLEYAFNELNLQTIVSVCPVVNKRSAAVMQKIGMQEIRTFDHPLLTHDAWLKNCVLYQIFAPTSKQQNPLIFL